MKLNLVMVAAASSLLLFSCVSSKKFKTAQAEIQSLQSKQTQLQGDLNNCNDAKAELGRKKTTLEGDNASLHNKISDLNKQINFLKANNTSALKQLEDLSVISTSQAESIRKSMENIGAKDAYIQTPQQQMAHKDSLNMALVMNLKGLLAIWMTRISISK